MKPTVLRHWRAQGESAKNEQGVDCVAKSQSARGTGTRVKQERDNTAGGLTGEGATRDRRRRVQREVARGKGETMRNGLLRKPTRLN